MSLFVNQQNIPFQVVLPYLHLSEPRSTTDTADWAHKQIESVGIGDVLFLLDPQYSPWGDASSGIGVGEGDTFRIARTIFVLKSVQKKLVAYTVEPESFELVNDLEQYLSEQVSAARGAEAGFYYLLIKPSTQLSGNSMQALFDLDEYGSSGWRTADAETPDLPFAFFAAVGAPIAAPTGQALDCAQLASLILTSKTPPSGSHLPDLTGLYDAAPAEGAPQNGGAGEDQGQAPTPGPIKLASFFSGNKGGQSAAPQPPSLKTPGVSRKITPPPAPPPKSGPSLPAFKAEPKLEPAAQAEPEPYESSAESRTESPAESQPAWQADSRVDSPADSVATEPESAVEAAPPVEPPVEAEAPPVQTQMKLEPPADEPESKVEAAQEPKLETSEPAKFEAAESEEPSAEPSNSEQKAAKSALGRLGDALRDDSMPKAGPVGGQDAPASGSTSAKQNPLSLWGLEPEAETAAAASDESGKSKEAKTDRFSKDADAETESITSAGKKKKADDATRAEQLKALAQLNEPVAVRSGVAGLVSKLEQQANKASARLETQVEEIQSRLNAELARLLEKVSGTEKRSTRSTEGLRMNLTTKMDSVTNEVKGKIAESAGKGTEKINAFVEGGSLEFNEKHSALSDTLRNSFDEVRTATQAMAADFETKLTEQAKDTKRAIEDLRTSTEKEFSEMHERSTRDLESAYNHFKERIESILEANTTALKNNFESLGTEINELDARLRQKLESNRNSIFNDVARIIEITAKDIIHLQALSITESTTPKYKEHRDMLRILGTEMQHRLSSDLDNDGHKRVAEFEPVLREKKQILTELVTETDKIKTVVQQRLRSDLDDVFKQLRTFVDQQVEQAKKDFERTEAEISEIDRAVRALADPSSIEGDLDLLSERNNVLEKLSSCGESAKEKVLSALKVNVAGLEEKGKQLQEELITTMEEDAYVVRRASEQSLLRIRQSIKDVFAAIQAAQDERME